MIPSSTYFPTQKSENIGRRNQVPWAAAVATLLVAACLSVPQAQGQCTLGGTLSTWNVAGNGNWSNDADWNPVGFPNSSSRNVCITNGTSTVTLDTNASVANLQLAAGNTLTTSLNRQLAVFGTQILNGGQIVLNGGAATNSFLILDNSVTLSGGGTLTMTVAGGGGNTFIQQGVGGVTLTNQGAIQGAGVIGNGGLALSNPGTINANASGQALLLNGSGIANTNLLEATNNGVLQINGTTVNNVGGNITANGGTVQFFGSVTIQGGTLNTSGGGTLGTPSGNAARLDGSTGAGMVTVNGTYTSALNTQTTLLGTINDKGNIQLNGGNATNSFLLMGSGSALNTTLQGGYRHAEHDQRWRQRVRRTVRGWRYADQRQQRHSGRRRYREQWLDADKSVRWHDQCELHRWCVDNYADAAGHGSYQRRPDGSHKQRRLASKRSRREQLRREHHSQRCWRGGAILRGRGHSGRNADQQRWDAGNAS